MKMNDIAISVRNVSKCYKVFDDQKSRLLNAINEKYTSGMHEVWALNNINFEIRRGEAVAIIGRNGSGKSTLLEILTGTLTPTTGSIKVNGRVSALLELGSGFNPEYTGRDNVILNGLLLGLTRKQILDRFDEIESFADVGLAIDRPVKTYSSGMIMRLAFAVQVLSEPDILIIDEALSVGDFFFQQKCLSYIRNLCVEGTTLLFVSHDMGTVRDTCERGILIHQSDLIFDGSNLEAIRRYVQADNDVRIDLSEREIENGKPQENRSSTKGLKLTEPFWRMTNDAELVKLASKKSYIISVGIYDGEGKAITSSKMGSKLKIRVHFKLINNEQVHVNIVIKNKYDQIITAVGSYGMKTPLPCLKNGDEAIFDLDIQLSIEAGDYVLSASLGMPMADGMSGVMVDETPWLGPFQVSWDYTQEVPPFYGMAGMNCNGTFII